LDPEKLLETITALCEGLRADMQKQCEKMDAKIDAVADAMKKKKDNDDDLAEQTAADGRRADSVSKSEIDYLRAAVRDLQIKQPRTRTDADRNAFADWQSKADVAHRALGGQADAPMAGEELADYVCRLHRPLLKHSKKWAKADLFALSRDSSTLSAVLNEVRADAVAASMSPEGMPEFQHRAIETIGPGGHRIVTWVGNGSFYKQLTRPARHIQSIGAKNQGVSRNGGFYSASAV
jgi:hypothetical protein